MIPNRDLAPAPGFLSEGLGGAGGSKKRAEMEALSATSASRSLGAAISTGNSRDGALAGSTRPHNSTTATPRALRLAYTGHGEPNIASP